MSTPRTPLALVVPMVLAVGGVSALALPSASAADPIGCDADYVSLRVSNGQNQYFTCADSGGEIRQTFSSKNPWVIDPNAPAIFEQPLAGPGDADGQVYTGSTQGVGVISSEDDTGAERDSIGGGESLTLVRDAGFERNFDSLQLGVTVLADDTTIVVEPVDANGVGLGSSDTFTANAGYTGSPVFEGDTPWDAAGFRISVDGGEFTIDGKRTTRFYFRDTTPPGPVSGLSAERLATALTLSWMNPTDPDLSTVVVTRTGAAGPICEGDETLEVCADSGLMPGTDYTYTVSTVDTSGNSTSVTETFTTRDGLSEGNPSVVVTDGQSQIQAEFAGGGAACPVTDEAPLPFELTLDETRTGDATSPDQVEFEFVEFDDRNVEDCKFTLTVFTETTQILTLAFDADGDGTDFVEVEQELCVGGAPFPGKTRDGVRNDSISCLESSTLATGLVAPDGEARDGQLAVLTGYFDARGRLFK